MVLDSSIRNSDLRVFRLDVYGLSRTVLDISSEKMVVVNLVIPFHYPEGKKAGFRLVEPWNPLKLIPRIVIIFPLNK